MENKKPWLSYDKISNLSDAFSYIKDIGFDLNDSFEHLNQGSPVRAKGIPTEKYTAGNTNDASESITTSESFLTQNPSSVARRYSPSTKQEYSGYRPPDPVFMSYQDSRTNFLVSEGPTKYKSLSDFDKKSQKGFSVKQLATKKEEVLISPEAKEFLQMLQKTNPEINLPEVDKFKNEVEDDKEVSQAYNIDAKPIEIKTTTTNQQIKTVQPIVITKTSGANKAESLSIEIQKPAKTTRVSQYTQPIDFFSINNNKTEIIDTKLQNKILNTNTVNLSKISNDVNEYITNISFELRQNLIKNIISELANYDGDVINNISKELVEVVNNSLKIDDIQSNIINLFENKLDQKSIAVFNNFLSTDLKNIISSVNQDFILYSTEVKNVLSETKVLIQNNQNNTTLSEVNSSINTFKNIVSNISLESLNTSISSVVMPLENIVNQTTESYNYNLFNNFLSNIQNINNQEVQNLKNEIINLLNQKTSIEVVNEKAVSLSNYLNVNNITENDYSEIIKNIFEQHLNTIVANANHFYTQVLEKQLQVFDDNYVQELTKADLSKNLVIGFEAFKNNLDIKEIRSNVVNSITNNENIDSLLSVLNQNISNQISNNYLQENIKTIIEQEVNNYNEKTLKITENRQIIDNFEKVINESIISLTKDVIYKASEIETPADNESISNLLFNIKTVNSNIQNTNNLDYSVQSLNMIENSIQNTIELLGDEIINQTTKVVEEEYNNSSISQEQYNEIINIFNSSLSKYDIINKIRHYLSQYQLDTKFTNNHYVNNINTFESLNKFSEIKNETIESYISKIYKTSIELNNVSQSLINTKEVLNIFQKTIDKISVLAPNNQVVSELQEKLIKTQNQDITNKFFNLVTSSNIVEEEIKNYLISKNESISNYTLNLIKENVYKSAFDDYVFVNEIKEIIENNNTSNSFTTLTEIKQFLNNYNLEEVKVAFSEIKNILQTSSIQNTMDSSVIENIDNYVNNISQINRELVQKTLSENTTFNEFRNVSNLNRVTNSVNNREFNTAINNIFNQLNNTTDINQILDTINTELNNISVAQINTENSIFNQNSEFINEVYNSIKNTEESTWENKSSEIKQSFLNETKSITENIFNNQNIKIESIQNILNTVSNNSFDSKTVNQIKNVIDDSILTGNYNYNQNTQLTYLSNYLNNIAYKIEIIENTNIQKNLEEVNQTAQQTAIKYDIQNNNFKNEINILNTFKNKIENLSNYEEIRNLISDFKTSITQYRNEQIDFVANQLIQNNEYRTFILDNKNSITLSNLEQTLETNSIVLNSEIKQVLNNVLESSESLQTVVNNFSNITEQNISSVYQTSTTGAKLSDFNSVEKVNLINQLNTIYSEEVVKQRFENFEEKTYSNLFETIKLINMNNTTTVQQKIDSIVNSISFMSTTRDSILEYLMKNFNVFNMEKTFNNLTKTMIENVNHEIENYDIQKSISNIISDNIFINQNVFNSQVIQKASNIIFRNLQTDLNTVSVENVLSEDTRKQIVDDFSNEFKKSENYSIFNSIEIKTSQAKLDQAIQKAVVNTYNSNYSQLNVLDFETKKSSTNYPDNVSKITTTNIDNYETKNTSNNLQVINNEEDVDVSNLRIDKIWNNFVKTEIEKVVEEIDNSSSINQATTKIDQIQNDYSSTTNNFSEVNYKNETNNFSNQNNLTNQNNQNYYSINNEYKVDSKNPNVINKEINIQENTQINVSEITQTIFEKIETRLKTYNVTQEDIILLKQKIIVEVTEYYEKKSYEQNLKIEQKLKKDVEDMFVRFLNT